MAAEVFPKDNPPTASSEYLNAAQICAIFRIKDRTLRRRVKSGGFVPHILVGKKESGEPLWSKSISPSAKRRQR
jgi:hypothetical protein